MPVSGVKWASVIWTKYLRRWEPMGKQTGRRLAMLIAGIGLMGPGIALFKLVLMGNDPHTALMIALGNWLGVDFSVVLFAVNCLWFSVEWRLGKTLIGIGTFVNWFFVGTLASLCEKAVLSVWMISEGPGPRLWIMMTDIVTLSLACAFCQTADLGVAPYDALSIILSRRSGCSAGRSLTGPERYLFLA